MTFRDSARSSIFFEGSEFGDEALEVWNQHPPYPQYAPSDEGLDTARLLDALHGKRYRNHQAADAHRISQHYAMPMDLFVAFMHGALLEELRNWENLKQCLKNTLLSSFDLLMGKQLLRWKARHVHCLYLDFQAITGSAEQFFRNYTDRWSQRL